MSTYQGRSLSLIQMRVEELLTEVWGNEVQLAPYAADLKASGRTQVYRFSLLEKPVDAPQHVIVKAMPMTEGISEASNTAPENSFQLFFNDWAGLQFLSEIAPHPALAPRFYAGNKAHGLIVMEDLGTGNGLHHLLLADNPEAAEEATVQYAATVGKMHAATIGKQEAFAHIRQELGPVDIPDYTWISSALWEAIHTLNVAPAAGIEDELKQLTSIMENPGPFSAYTHGDPCPDNIFIGTSGKLFDFEFGAYRHALIEGVYARMPFPTCWCVSRLPAHIIHRMETSYRMELAKSCPAAHDDRLFAQAVAAASAYWTIDDCRFLHLHLKQDWQWSPGLATARQRFLRRFDVAREAIEASEYLQAIGKTFERIASRLREFLPPEADQMPDYPAFR
ncbi:MAG TPA: phosphotransferase [Ktedonobacteraceae bacterium]